MWSWQNFADDERPISHDGCPHALEHIGLEILNIDFHQIHMHRVKRFVLVESQCLNFKLRRALSCLPALRGQGPCAFRVQAFRHRKEECRASGLARQRNIFTMNATLQSIQPNVSPESFKYLRNRLKSDDLEIRIPKRPQDGVQAAVRADVNKCCGTLKQRSQGARSFGLVPVESVSEKKRTDCDSCIPPDPQVLAVGQPNGDAVLADTPLNSQRNPTRNGAQWLRGICQQRAEIVVIAATPQESCKTIGHPVRSLC